jgi:hypothetical protein
VLEAAEPFAAAAPVQAVSAAAAGPR